MAMREDGNEGRWRMWYGTVAIKVYLPINFALLERKRKYIRPLPNVSHLPDPLFFHYRLPVRHRPEQNMVTWKTTSSEAFVPLSLAGGGSIVGTAPGCQSPSASAAETAS
jgi:hypothetical protein